MSEKQTNQSPQKKEEGGRNFGAQGIPNIEPPKKGHGSFGQGAVPKENVVKTQQTASGRKESRPAKTAVTRVLAPIDKPFELQRLIALLVVLIPLGIWASWQAWERITYAWENTLDYGHGWFIIPLVAYFLWSRRDSYPGTRHKPDWLGLFPIVIYAVMRYVASTQYFDAIDEWAIFFWLISTVWFFYGTKVFLWALPSLGFLVFMFQLPFSYEALLRSELQGFAAQFAAILLQLVGEPAIPIKNTIRLSTMELGVKEACSGIRFLISILAIAFATALLFRRPWWQNIFIVAFAVPLALFVNAARIAFTGILLVHYNGFVEWLAGKDNPNLGVVADEFSGLVLIFVALGIFAFFVWYLGKVFRRVTI